MAKIARKSQKIFASTAGPQQLGIYGSLAAGLPAYSTDPETIQSLPEYLTGWFGAVLGNNSPAIEDMNSLCYLFAYQLAYTMQAGIPEWDDGTTYYIGSLVMVSGEVYVSLTDDNLNNLVTNQTNWALKIPQSGRVRDLTGAGLIGQTDGMVRMTGTAGYTASLPAPASTPIGKRFSVKNVSSNGSVMTVDVVGGALIDGAASVTMESNPVFESYTFSNNGTSYDVV